MTDELLVFWGRANEPLAQKVCQFLDEDLNRGCLQRRSCIGRVMITDFPDGEVHCKIENNVRGRDVFIIQPTCPPVNQNLMELLIMIDSFKRASAGRITAVIPYFGYARQDRKEAGRVPLPLSWWPTSLAWRAPTGCSPWTSIVPKSKGFSISRRSPLCRPGVPSIF
jgi:ribose-phosphate pyrophosphokinase